MIKYILTLFLFLAECTAIDNSEDCCSSINLCGHNQGNCKTDEDCQGDFTCEDTCPDGFPDGYKCCKNLCKFILNTLKYSIYYIKCFSLQKYSIWDQINYFEKWFNISQVYYLHKGANI